jgi:hypothetical protein
MAQAKITVSREQAVKLMCLVHKKKPMYPILYDPRSGVNLRETKPGEFIEVPDGANLYNLQRFFEAGYFDVIEGKIAAVTSFKSVSVGEDGFVTLYFDQPVYTAELTGGTDFIVKVNGTEVPDLQIAAVAKNNFTKTLKFDLGDVPAKGSVVSVEITQTGANKIKDAGDAAVKAATHTFKI